MGLAPPGHALPCCQGQVLGLTRLVLLLKRVVPLQRLCTLPLASQRLLRDVRQPVLPLLVSPVLQVMHVLWLLQVLRLQRPATAATAAHPGTAPATGAAPQG